MVKTIAHSNKSNSLHNHIKLFNETLPGVKSYSLGRKSQVCFQLKAQNPVRVGTIIE